MAGRCLASRSEHDNFPDSFPAIHPETASPKSGHARIAVDAMGGDLGPAEVVEAVKLALSDESIDPIMLVGAFRICFGGISEP